MSHETFLVVALIFSALLMTGAILVVSLRTTPPPARAAARPAGLLAKLACPVTHAPVRVRIGPDPATRTLAVVWCERFPAGALDCGRGCFSVLQEPGNLEAASATA